MPSTIKPTELSDDELRAILTDKPTKQTIQKAESKSGRKFSAKTLTNLLRKAR